jgi:hypothetical protein
LVLYLERSGHFKREYGYPQSFPSTPLGVTIKLYFQKDTMNEVEAYINEFEGEQKSIMLFFHNWFTRELNLISKIRFKIPFYYQKSWLCYLNPIKPDGVELAFLRGNELSNEQGLLEAKDRKQVYGITFRKVIEIPDDLVNEIIQEALLLDQVKPYSVRKKK